MSFGFGVGDVVALLQAIKAGYDKYKDAPVAVKDAVRDVKKMHAGLTFIQKNYPVSEKEFIRVYGENV
jgi:hypothetical protein